MVRYKRCRCRTRINSVANTDENDNNYHHCFKIYKKFCCNIFGFGRIIIYLNLWASFCSTTEMYPIGWRGQYNCLKKKNCFYLGLYYILLHITDMLCSFLLSHLAKFAASLQFYVLIFVEKHQSSQVPVKSSRMSLHVVWTP